MGDLTGENSGLGQPPRNGAKLAFDQYNATNPVKKIEFIEYDSQGSPDQAVPLVTKAIQQDKIVGLIGPTFSGESKAADPVLEQAGIPNISASATNPGLARNGWKYFHRVLPDDAAQGPAVADFLVAAKNPRKAFVISDDQEYSVGLADAVNTELRAKGVNVARDRFSQQASDYSSSVAKIKADIEAVRAGNTTPEAINRYLATISFPGVAKPIKFQPDGNVANSDIFVYAVHNSRIGLLGNTKVAKLG